MPPKAAGGRIGYGDHGNVGPNGQASTVTPRQKGNQRISEASRKSGGLAGTERARAQKPVSGQTDTNTVSAQPVSIGGRPTTGAGGMSGGGKVGSGGKGC